MREQEEKKGPVTQPPANHKIRNTEARIGKNPEAKDKWGNLSEEKLARNKPS